MFTTQAKKRSGLKGEQMQNTPSEHRFEAWKDRNSRRILRFLSAIAAALCLAISALAQAPRARKVFIETDMEGVDGIYDFELQCIPWKSPRWQESVKLLTDEINAAIDGLLQGGATEVVVCDNHTGQGFLSLLDLNPKAKLITGFHTKPTTLGMDPSYAGLVFIGRHAMSGADKGILAHTQTEQARNVWVNDVPVGELGLVALTGAGFGIPTIMVSGDTAACREALTLFGDVECAEVKSGFNATSGIMLPHRQACDLIRDKARHSMERLPDFHPYKVKEPVELKVQLAHDLSTNYDTTLLSKGAQQLPDWIFVFRGKTYLEVHEKWLGPAGTALNPNL
jgi:D-amino peptidase